MTNAPEETPEARSPVDEPPPEGHDSSENGETAEKRPPEGDSGADRRVHRARFLAEWPDNDALQAVGEAFEAGNYALVRERAPALLDHDDATVRAAAKDVLERIEPDPLVKYMLFLSLLLLLAVTAFAYGGHGH